METTNTRTCSSCNTPYPDKGRAMDGRRVYRCKNCNNIWSEGMQGREKQYSYQRQGNQFFDSKGKGHLERNKIKRKL